MEQRGEEVVEVETALPCGADDAGEDLLGLRATLRAIAATDLAIDHGGPDGVLGSPVGRVDVDGPEEGEHGREFAVEMGGEALRRRQGGCRVDKPSQAGEEAAAGDGEAMLGDRLRIAPIAERQGGGQGHWCADVGRPTRFKPSSPSPPDAVRDGSAKLGHPVQNVTREHGLTPLPR